MLEQNLYINLLCLVLSKVEYEPESSTPEVPLLDAARPVDGDMCAQQTRDAHPLYETLGEDSEDEAKRTPLPAQPCFSNSPKRPTAEGCVELLIK